MMDLRKARSKYEWYIMKNSNNLEGFHNTTIEYETVELKYVIESKYTPDFILRDENGDAKILIEAKGHFRPADRKKLLAVKKQHPEVDLRILFQKPHNRLSSRAKMTYAQWAEKHKFPWAEGAEIPWDWITEAVEIKED